MKSAILAISPLKASLAVLTKVANKAGFPLIVAMLLSLIMAALWSSYARAEAAKQLHEQWRQESLQYWKLKNALINIGIEDVMEVQDGLSEIRRPNGAVEYWRAP